MYGIFSKMFWLVLFYVGNQLMITYWMRQCYVQQQHSSCHYTNIFSSNHLFNGYLERAVRNRKRWREWREIIKSHSKEEQNRRLLKLYPLNTLEDHCFNTKKVHAYCYSVMSRCIRLMIKYSHVLNVKLCIIVCALWVHVGSYAHNNIG